MEPLPPDDRSAPTPQRPSPYALLAQALRDELISTRYRAGLSSTRDVTRALGLDPDNGSSGNVKRFKFERGETGWPRYPDELVDDYARACGVAPAVIWQGAARRWHEALSGTGGTGRRAVRRQAREDDLPDVAL